MRPVFLLALAGCFAGSAPQDYELAPIPDRFVELSLKNEVEAEDGDGDGIMKDAKQKAWGGAASMLGKFETTGGKGAGNDGFFGAVNGIAPAPPAEPAALREWFPEAFLWRPSLQTDEDGVASVDVRVPDQLTTWRVLALAHDAEGFQTGSEHQFDSTLPAYVDPVVPGWSYVGDRFELPVQVVNNRALALTGLLTVDLEGALVGSTQSQLQMGAFGSTSRRVSVRAVSAGEGRLNASLVGVDRVRRAWSVTPIGRPVVQTLGGTLSGERALELSWPDGSDARTARFQVEVQPGPLAVLRAELERIDAGGGWSRAHAYGVLRMIEEVAETVGEPVDAPTLQRVKKRAWQRLVRRARNPSAAQAARLLVGLRGEQTGLESALQARLVRKVVDGQRGDGSWSLLQRDTVQSVLVQTAATLRVLPKDALGPRLRASGALERLQPNIDDPFTAAVVIASGGLQPSEKMVELLLSGIVPIDPDRPNGASTFRAPLRVVNTLGVQANDAEAKAWMVLALLRLGSEHKVLAGDLASQLMSEGATSGVQLEAIVAALPTVGQPIQLTMELGGQTISTASIDPAQPGLPVLMAGVPDGVAPGQLVLRSSPSAAGLAFSLTQRAWVPWSGDEALPGVDIEVEQGVLVAGSKGRLTITIAAPSGSKLTVVQGLPSGMVVENEAALRARPDVLSVEVGQDQVLINTTAFGAGEVREYVLEVVPRYAGEMRARPMRVSHNATSVQLPPHVWKVR